MRVLGGRHRGLVPQPGRRAVRPGERGDHDLDEVAYLRFASVYRRFEDVNQFMEELKTLLLTRDE